MSEVINISDKTRIREEASVWVARVDRGLNEKEKAQFSEWLLADGKHEVVFSELAKLWDNMDALNQLADIFPKDQAEIADERSPRNFSWLYRIAPVTFSVVTLIVVVNIVIIIFNGGLFSSGHQFEGHFVTAVGEQSSIVLNDGSILTLNTNSRVEVLFSPDERLLKLKHGELHIEVAHDSNRPLSVFAGGKIVQAVGTAFNVQLGRSDIEVIVTEGKVLVTDSESPTDKNPQAAIAQTLEKGEIAVFAERDQFVARLAEDEIRSSLSWRQGKIIFSGEELSAAIEEISRYTAMEITLVDPELSGLRIAGRFKAGDIDGMLFALKENFGIQSSQQGNHILLSRNESF